MQFLQQFRDLQHFFLLKNTSQAHFYFYAYVVVLYLFLIYKDSVGVETLQYYLAKEPFYQPNQYPPITILVARTQCVFPVSLRTGKRRARTTVKRIVISPADKQKQTTPTLSYYQSQSCCACIVSLEPGVISGLYCLSAWELFLFKWNLQVR